MLAELPIVVTDTAALAAAFLAVVTAVGVAARLRPVRWVWRRLVSGPIAGWLATQHAEALAPLQGQVGQLDGKVDRMEVRQEELGVQLVTHMADEIVIREKDLAERAARQASIDGRLDRIEERLDDGGGRFDSLDDQVVGLRIEVGRAMAALSAGNPEVRAEPPHRIRNTWGGG